MTETFDKINAAQDPFNLEQVIETPQTQSQSQRETGVPLHKLGESENDTRDESPNVPIQQQEEEESIQLDFHGTDSLSEDDVNNDSKRRLYKIRHTFGAMVNHPTVQLWIVILIIINAIIMGVATFDFVTDDPEVESTFEKVDRGFLVVFTIELVFQIIYRGIGLFTDGWLVFDFFIVIFSWAFESLQIIRAFRIFRALRLVTRVRQLRDLVLALGAVLPRMNAIAALLMLIFYIFAVLFTELFKDLDLSSNYFRTLDASLLTCVELMTLEWAGIVREVMSFHDWAWLPFLVFINITGFIVFNLIVAVVCDAVSVVERQNHEVEEEGEDNDDEDDMLDAQGRIDGLGQQIVELMNTQNEMQELLKMLASDAQRNHLENGLN